MEKVESNVTISVDLQLLFLTWFGFSFITILSLKFFAKLNRQNFIIIPFRNRPVRCILLSSRVTDTK